MNKDEINWQAQEYIYREKNQDWYWGVGIIALAIIIASIVYGNILFALLILLGAFTMIMVSFRHPKNINFKLNKKGLLVGKRFFPYPTLKSFWVIDEPHAKKIIFESDRFFMPHIEIPLSDEIDSEEIRDFLLEMIPEEEHEESWAENFMNRLGF